MTRSWIVFCLDAFSYGLRLCGEGDMRVIMRTMHLLTVQIKDRLGWKGRRQIVDDLRANFASLDIR